MTLWYNLDHEEITVQEAEALLADYDARQVGYTEIGSYVVSTVFLVLDHQFGEGPPVLYETMVFTASAMNPDADDPDPDPLLELDAKRYCTLAEAQAGHEEMCLLIRATISEEIPSADPCTITYEEEE